MKRNKDHIIVLIFILIAGCFYLYYSYERSTPDTGEYRVVKVIDGDTIIIDDGRETSVRYIGIDCPEILHEGSAGDPFAERAMRLNEKLLQGNKVRLEYDKEKYDNFGRLLAYVYSDGSFVNIELVENGLAKKFIFEPNDRYEDEIDEAEDEAKSKRLGIWGDLGSMTGPPGNERYLVDLSDAGKYTGKRVVVEGKITDARATEKMIALAMGKEFNVTIYEGDWPNFEFFRIDPYTYYNGKTLRVTGRVRKYRGKPSMVVGHPMSIRIIE